MLEKTLSIIKPDAVKKGKTNEILNLYKENGFEILKRKTLELTKEEAADFYSIHKDRPFFESLILFMSSGPISVQVLQKENAVLAHREIMGATNPKEAKPGTIRFLYGESIDNNAVHGSDSLENAKKEILFFFNDEA